jgi:hypothetical protein
MPRSPDSGQLDFSEVFLRVQQEMIAQMAVGGLFEHASSAGDATEQHWIDLFTRYLPLRYRATPAFVVDSTGRRSRQIDIAIFDNLYSPLLFPHSSGLHIAAESVYAVFEVKPTISKQWIRDAGEKAASVRALHRTSVPVIAGGTPRSAIPPSPILAGFLATGSVWSAETFGENVRRALASTSPSERLDLGCSLQHGAFEWVGQAVPSADPRVSQSSNVGQAVPPADPRVSRSSNVGQAVPPADPRVSRSSHVGQPILAASRVSTRLSSPSSQPVADRLLRCDRQGVPSLTSRDRLAKPTSEAKRERINADASPNIHVSSPDESLIFFILRLLQRMREMGTAPAADLMEYGRSLRSFQQESTIDRRP